MNFIVYGSGVFKCDGWLGLDVEEGGSIDMKFVFFVFFVISSKKGSL